MENRNENLCKELQGRDDSKLLVIFTNRTRDDYM